MTESLEDQQVRYAVIAKEAAAKKRPYKVEERTNLLPTSTFKTLRFENNDLEWLDFICQSRQGKQPQDGYDFIEGGVANGSVVDTVEAYRLALWT